MQEMQFDDLRVAKAAQILLADYGLYSEVDDYDMILAFDDDITFEDEDWEYVDFIADYIGDELYMNYDVESYRNTLIDLLDFEELDDMIDELDLCLLDISDNLFLYCDDLPTIEGFYDVYIHYDKNRFSTPNSKYTAEEVAYLIQQDDQWDREHQGIRLMSCYAGCTNAYIEIANILGCTVRAPMGKVITHQGYMQYWVILDEWFTMLERISKKRRKMKLRKMIANNDYRLSDDFQNTLWVEYCGRKE